MATTARHPRLETKAQKTTRNQSGGGEVRELRTQFGLSQALLARLLDVSLRTVSGAGNNGIVPATMRRNLNQAQRLCTALTDAMAPTYVGRWLDEPNEMLGGLKPVEAVERGQLDLVWQVVEGLRSGSQL